MKSEITVHENREEIKIVNDSPGATRQACAWLTSEGQITLNLTREREQSLKSLTQTLDKEAALALAEFIQKTLAK